MDKIVDKFDLSVEENIFFVKKNLDIIIYNSAKLEGINVTFFEVKTILDGENVSGVRLDDINSILNMRDAWREILNDIDSKIDIDYICRINSFVSRNESLEWGVLRTGKVGITGVSYVPPVPEKDKVIEDLESILKINNVTLRAIKYMLYGMRSQLFWDGNKRTSMMIANKIMISNGKGIITVKEENLLEFNKLLTEYYNTGDDEKIVEFIYETSIYGLE